MNVETIYCEVCSLTFTEYELETTNACPYCGNQAAETLLGLVDDEIEGVLCDEC
jgi:rRNA maturation endonuclease Nob1